MRWAPGAGRAVYVLLVLALWSTSLTPLAAADLAADRAALLAFRDAVGPHLPWNATTSSSPCGWRGVTCDPAGARVTALQLPAASLVGAVPVGTVGNLTALRALSLRLNALSGGIPADIEGCAELRYLYLQGNRLDGQIPQGLFDLRLLQRLDLSGNRIGGGVSADFNRLQRLATLYLENNGFNGTLPSSLDLPKLQLFNVSGNNLTGAVPTSLAGMPASAFDGTGLCGAPLAACPSPPPPPPSPSPPPPPTAPSTGKNSRGLSTAAIAGIAAGGAVAFLVLIAAIVFLCFRCRRTKAADKSADTSAEVDLDASPDSVTAASTDNKKKSAATRRSSSQAATAAGSTNKKLVFLGSTSGDAPPYDLESLLHASAEVIGKGWLGTTYRATLEGGAATVAVKRLRSAPIPEREFRDKVSAMAALRHENLVPVRAYFYSRDEKLVVYDYVPGGSLCSLLHGTTTTSTSPARLNFVARARIALAAARGVAFIHGNRSSCHGNIKSTNVVVTDARDGGAGACYVTDHGILQLVGAHVPLKRVTGYRAPEVADPRVASREADVYGFGVLLLEVLTGKPPVNSVPGSTDGVDLPAWVRTVVQEEWTAEVFDAGIAVEERVEEEMIRMLQLALDCTDAVPERRPRMADVVARIELIVDSALLKVDADATEDDDFHSISP